MESVVRYGLRGKSLWFSSLSLSIVPREHLRTEGDGVGQVCNSMDSPLVGERLIVSFL